MSTEKITISNENLIALLWTYNINNSNRTEWTPIRSVIKRLTKSDDGEAGVWFVNHKYDYRLNWTTRRPVTNYSKLWQNSRNKQNINWALNDFKIVQLKMMLKNHLKMMLKNPAVCSTKCTTTACAKKRILCNYNHDVCNCPINAQIRLLIANHVREFCLEKLHDA